MKTHLLIMPLAALALASCSQDEPVSVNRGQAIDFRPAMGTRVAETTNANLSDIYVTAMIGSKDYFSNLKFSKGGDGFFASTPEYYWPGDTSTITFYAYAPSQDEIGADVIIDADQKQLVNFSAYYDISQQVDFITAKATGTKAANESTGVPLTFKHRLAQIELRAKNENSAYTIKVTGMRIGRPVLNGTFDFATETWTLDDWHDTDVFESKCDEVTLSATPVSIMGTGGNAMLVPQTLTAWDPKGDPDNVAREAYLSVLVNITATESGTQIYPFPSDTKTDENGNPRKYAWASIPLTGTWEQGKKYVYTLDFTHGAGNVDPDDPTPGKPVLGDPIKFTVSVDDWNDADTSIPMTPVK